NTDLFDYYLSFEINQTPITTHQFRIPFSKNLNTEIWCNLDNHQKYLFYFYPTINNKLSSKVGILNSDIYEYYVSLLKEKIIKNDKIILICEYPYKAQDNGFFFFKYLMEKQDKYTAFYMITDDSKDLANLKPYMDHVVFFKSKEHIRLLFEAGYLFHSHTSLYSLPFPTKKLFENKKNMKKIFLGHGITASKNIGYFYGDKKNNPEMTDIVIVSSKREKQQFHKQLHHSLENIKITGLARFDNLLKGNNFLKSYTLRKKILIMPTWRNGENKLSDEEFVKTKFFHFYSDLINNSTLRNLVKNKRIKIDFYLHNNFQKSLVVHETF